MMAQASWWAIAWLALCCLASAACSRKEARDVGFGTPAPAEVASRPVTPAPDAGDPAEVAAPKRPAVRLYGDGTYPCTGHPTCDRAPPADHHLALTAGGIPTIDPALVTESEGMLVIHEIFEGLLTPGPSTGPPGPGVARAWTISADGRRYTFSLRPDARWSSGRPVTADDFRYAWIRKLRPETGARGAENLWFINNGEAFNEGRVTDPEALGVRAPDDHTLVVELERPAPYFIWILLSGHYHPVPRDVVEARGKDWTRPEHIVTNGPYHVASWKERDRLELVRSETYWNRAAVRIPRVVIRHSESQDQMVRLYELGETHYVRAVGGERIKRFLAEARPDLFIDRSLCFYYYAFNTRQPPLDDARVRRAINLAIDKERLVRHGLGAMQTPADSPIPDHYAQTMGYERAGGDGFDPTRARALLAEAGYPGGVDLPPLTISYNTFETHRVVAELVQRSLKEHLGITVRLENMEWKSLLKRIHARDYQIGRMAGCAIPDPYDHLVIFYSKSDQNHSGYADPAFDALFEQALETVDEGARLRLYTRAERLALAATPVAPIYHYTSAYLKLPALRGIDPELQKRHLIRYVHWADQPPPPAFQALPPTVAPPPTKEPVAPGP